MAKARMLHNKISRSLQVGSLPTGAQLLFTWSFSHADDDGRMLGDPRYVKITVVPILKWSLKTIRTYLELMDRQRLIHYWQVNNEWYIEFINWRAYQHIRKKLYTPSVLPSFCQKKDAPVSSPGQHKDDLISSQYSVVQSNPVQFNKSEYKNIADKKSFKSSGEIIADKYPDPLTNYHPNNEKETVVLEIWNKLEPDNPKAFYTTYLPRVKQPIHTQQLFIYYREIKDDKTIRKPGAVFNTKVDAYLAKKASTSG